MAKPKRLHAVAVTWRDATGMDSWAPIDAHMDVSPVQVESVGFLLRKTPKDVKLIQSVGGTDGETKGFASLTIPREWVTRVRRLR